MLVVSADSCMWYNVSLYCISRILISTSIDFYLCKYSAAEVKDLFLKNGFIFDFASNIQKITSMGLNFVLIS